MTRKKLLGISVIVSAASAILTIMTSLPVYAADLTDLPDTGNIEKKTYIIIAIVAGIILIGAGAAGIITKKKK